jgi:hypothetical protein
MKRRLNQEDVEVIGEDELTRLLKHRFHGDPSEAIRQFAGEPGANSFRDALARISAGCDAVLESYSLPAACEHVGVSPKGIWTPIAAATDPATGKRRKGFGSSTGARYVMGASQTFSEEWYAATIGELCGELDSASDPSDSVYQVNILQLGHLITDRFWRLTYKRSILRGASVRKGAQDGGALRAGQRGPHTRRVLNAMADRLGSMPKENIQRAANLVFKDGIGTSAKANRSLWYAHKKRKL